MASPAVVMEMGSDGIAVLTMQRGENRINNDLIRDFNSCLDKAEQNEKCVGVVTTGAGRFYCNGLDTSWMGTIDAEVLQSFLHSLIVLLRRILLFPLPTAAAINGHCYAGGGLIAMACDVRVMNNAKGWFCFNEVFINRRFSQFMIQTLRTKINPASTLHRALIFGQRYTGPESEHAGLIDKAVAPPMVTLEAKRMLQATIPKGGFIRESLQNMKIDLYQHALLELEPSKM